MLSVVIPALNEEGAVGLTVEGVRKALTERGIEHEVIVVNDGSTDRTGVIAREQGAVVIDHPQPGGYGKSLKDGIDRARFDIIAITDCDGTYPTERLPDLYRLVQDDHFDMAIGARRGRHYRGSFLKMPARLILTWLAQYAAGCRIDDINSGLRVFRKELVLRYRSTISNGFSFTATITLAALLNGYFVKYVPIDYHRRIGASKVRYWRDSLRSLQIIVENVLYYNPLKLFLLLVQFLLLASVISVAALLWTDSPRWFLLFATSGAVCFGSAFVVAAIGLAADLIRLRSLTRE